MRYTLKISSIILLTILFNKFSKEEKIPKFCDTPVIHGIYNFGPEIQLRYEKWIWTYNMTSLSMIEPPIDESKFNANLNLGHNRILATLYINEVMTPSCPPSMVQKDCDQQYKALDLLFIRLLDINKTFEFTKVIRMTANKKIKNVSIDEFPWNLNSDANCWPKEWNNDFEPKSSAFSPVTKYSYFISKSRNRELSKILYNQINTNNWYQNLKEEPFKSDIKFVGMFYLEDMARVYAVGDRSLKGDPISRIYLLDVSYNNSTNRRSYFMNDIKIEVRTFFGCYRTENTQQTIDIKTTTEFLHSSTLEEVEGVDKHDGNASIIIVVVVFVLIMTTVIIIIVFVVFKQNARKKTSQSKSLSKKKNNSTFDKTSTDDTVEDS